ncbi:hypothetical protein CALVIDRAFT_365816 [Calocera viscosa TUFC12733]|uniref:Uncharacterized protein n=1 Tax=Calocera viscosa (strain TUFC12733) TaxID=1330018 RepID=A0A167H3P4_CALVF|nr:hypothetical protein CALVIDRAFT_365816 [Calocera viscosa TUFC12733]
MKGVVCSSTSSASPAVHHASAYSTSLTQALSSVLVSSTGGHRVADRTHHILPECDPLNVAYSAYAIESTLQTRLPRRGAPS